MSIGQPHQKEIDTNAQSQTGVLFQYYLTQEIKTDITITEEVKVDDEVINVSAGHGFTANDGEVIIIRYGDIFEQIEVTGVSTDAISVDRPIANDFPVVGTTIIHGNINMNIDGSSTAVDFKYTNPASGGATIPIDISKVIITMQHGSNVPDDDKFGGITALAKGLFFRHENGSIVNYGNYTKNSTFREVGASVEYSDKAPAGTNGTNIIFDIESIFGQVIRLDPKVDDMLYGRIRDALNVAAGMAGMRASIVGSFTSGE